MGTAARQLNLAQFIPQHSYSTRFQGSKRRILGWLLQSLTGHLQHPGRVLDGFSGSGVVSYGFASMGWRVTAVDRLWSSYATVLGFAGGGASVTEDMTEAIIEHGLAYEGGPIFSTYRETFFFDDEMRWLEGAAEFIRSLPESDRGLPFWALFQSALAKRPYNLFHRANLNMRTRAVSRSFGNKTTWDRPFPEHFRKFVNEANSYALGPGVRPALPVVGDPVDVPGDYDFVYLDPPYINWRGVCTPYDEYYGFFDILWNPDLIQQIDRSRPHKPFLRQRSQWEQPTVISEAFRKIIEAHSGTTIAISYRTDGIPAISQLEQLLSQRCATVEVLTTPIQYALSKRKSSKEVLIIGYQQ